MCALATLKLLGRLDAIDVPKAIEFIESCRNFDGGYGTRPGSESHAGQVDARVFLLSSRHLLFSGLLLHWSARNLQPPRDDRHAANSRVARRAPMSVGRPLR